MEISTPSNSQVDIWCCSLKYPADSVAILFESLSLDEKERVRRYRFEHDRRRFIVGRAILRLLLGQYLNRDANSILFTYGDKGKPILSDTCTTLRFNLTHSEELVLYCFNNSGEIGIDVERIRTLPMRDSIAKNVLTEQELSVLKVVQENAKDSLFLRLWSRKESYLKALGVGLSCPMSRIDLSYFPLNESVDESVLLGELSGWYFYDLTPHPEFVGALVSERVIMPPQLRTFYMDYHFLFDAYIR